VDYLALTGEARGASVPEFVKQTTPPKFSEVLPMCLGRRVNLVAGLDPGARPLTGAADGHGECGFCIQK